MIPNSLQMEFYRHCRSGNKYIICSLDATGSIVKEVDVKHTTLKIEQPKTFLYQVMLYVDKQRSVPVLQMISQLGDGKSMRNFLANGFAEDKFLPDEMIVDCGLALIVGCILAFTDYKNIDSYNMAVILQKFY